MTNAAGVTISTLAISNDDAGFAEALAWIAEHAPGRRVIVDVEATRSYGIGLARAVVAPGLIVLVVEH
jgi:transposase